MLHHKTTTISALTLVTLFVCQAVGAAAIRLDSGDWDTVFSGDSATTSDVGFTMDFGMSFLGITGSNINVNSAGQLRLFDDTSANHADFNPFFDTGQVLGGVTTQFSLEETNAAFSATGVESGFRASWSALDSAGFLLNQFQVSFFELTGGQFAVEFNYDLLSFGDDGTGIGYSTTLGDSFDLLSQIGIAIDDALGVGDFDPTFPDLCLGTPDALACNNYYDGSFGPSDLVLPGIAGGYFRNLSGSDSTPVQGRYLFVVGNTVDIAEPSGLALIGIASLALGLARRRSLRGQTTF